MSNIVRALVQKRIVGSPTRKSMLLYTAGCASVDGSGKWCSKSTIARDLEYSKRTVQIANDEMVKSGLIAEVGNGRSDPRRWSGIPRAPAMGCRLADWRGPNRQ